MVSKGMQFVLNILTEQNKKAIEKRVQESRKGLEDLAKMVKVAKDIKVEPIDAEGVPGEWIIPPECEEDRVILYLHGGSYMSGSLNSHRELASRIARASKTKVLTIDYRLAPEHPFPEGLDDATKVYKWLIQKQNFNPKNIVITGDSAGGGLTLATLLNLKEKKIPLPAAGACLSPWTDLGLTGESYRTKEKVDPMVTPEGLRFEAKLYLGANDFKEPLISPLYGNLEGLPPLYLQVGTNEILLDDSVQFAEKAKREGVEVTLDIWEDMIHVFPAFAAFASEGQEGVEKIGEFIRNIFKL